MHTFTPRTKTGERLYWLLNNEDSQKIKRGKRWTAMVTNQLDGRLHVVQGASCGIPRCYCDAIVKV